MRSSSPLGLGFLLLLSLGAVLESPSPAMGQPASKPERILFIGNSLTASNDLPLLVEAMAASQGVALSTVAVTVPNFSLEDHWEGAARGALHQGPWSFVVLQQGPSSLASSRENLRAWAKKFGEEIREVGARPATYMVWPDRSRLKFLPDVSESYRLANADIGGRLIPVGEVWQAAWKRHRNLPLYGPDGFHPSRLGTYAAAATVLASLTTAELERLPTLFHLRNGSDYEVDAGEAAVVLAAVKEVTRPAKP